jgi:predicted DNA-binding protein
MVNWAELPSETRERFDSHEYFASKGKSLLFREIIRHGVGKARKKLFEFIHKSVDDVLRHAMPLYGRS